MRTVVTSPTGHLQLIDAPSPEPGPDDVLVQVEYAAINPVDSQTASGVYHSLGWISQPLHTGLGWDFAGIVAGIGSAAAAARPDLRPGTPVLGMSPGVDKPIGSLGEYVAVPSDAVVRRPEGLLSADATTIPLNGLTALQGLELLGGAGGRLLITGAAGAVGAFATHYALSAGWETIGFGRESDADFITSLGASAVSSLHTLTPVDAVFDTVGLPEESFAALKDGGSYVGVTPYKMPDSVRGIETGAVSVRPDKEQLERLARGAANGALPLRIARVLPLEDFEEAFAVAQQRGLRGRVVVKVS